ncbi:alanine racemase [Paenibacillus sp. IB182496]|uniref:Alanine racemase n=1 Tax=Paenibacillus sabuli TaxID=2772509 RepID=A0A927BQU1_9BACL|nr:alanine racemase [Paenibacillus sabuli]MBD2844070.1 alanine racemase [Paenibacillus sabuli]
MEHHEVSGAAAAPPVLDGYADLPTPQALIELEIAERNIARMAERLRRAGIRHRPHIKTSKSVTWARKQLEAGAIGISVAKLAEAEVFAAAGIRELLIAYPIIGAPQLRRFAALHAGGGELLTTIDSLTGARGLSDVGVAAGRPVQALIEIDGGLHRGGRQPGEDTLRFALEAMELPGLQIRGVMNYAGTIYRNTSPAGFIAAVQEEARQLAASVALLREHGIDTGIVSSGSTPSALYCEHLQGVTEVRAGNYLYFDASGVALGLAAEADCALRVLATVVSTPCPGRATIDAGTKTLTSDKAHNRAGHGIVVGRPDLRIEGLNEEHGFIVYDPQEGRLTVGDRLLIIPNHSCVIPNLYDALPGVRGGRVTERIAVEARGCNY